MTLTFAALGEKLPGGSIEFVGNNQLKLNFTLATGDSTLTPQSSCVKAIVKLVQALAELTDQVNEDRAAANPPLAAIQFASEALQGTPGQPEYRFQVIAKVNTANFVENLVDPTA